jgi:hypothetical protein
MTMPARVASTSTSSGLVAPVEDPEPSWHPMARSAAGRRRAAGGARRRGAAAGEDVEVNIELDAAAPEVTLRADLADALTRDDRVREFFDGLAYTNRKKWVRWVGDPGVYTEGDASSTRLVATATLPEAVRENEEVVPVNAVSTWVLPSGVTVGR